MDQQETVLQTGPRQHGILDLNLNHDWVERPRVVYQTDDRITNCEMELQPPWIGIFITLDTVIQLTDNV